MLVALLPLFASALHLPPRLRLSAPAPPAAGSLAARLQCAAAAAALSGALTLSGVSPALAIGPEQVPLKLQSYEEITCPEELRQGRAGGALGAGAGGGGIAQKCVAVKAKASNGSGGEIKDAGVFGVISDVETEMSVLGNGQDGKNDAGQFAMIDVIPKGDSIVDFVFVSQQSTECKSTRQFKCPVGGTEPLVKLKFEKLKAIAYPGGDRYKTYDECEQNEFAEGC